MSFLLLAHHRVGLASPSLAVGEDTHIVTCGENIWFTYAAEMYDEYKEK